MKGLKQIPIWAYLLMICLIASFIYAIYPVNRTNWKRAYGEIVRISIGRNGGRLFKYEVNGKTYQSWVGSVGVEGQAIGDRYELLYNPSDTLEIYIASLEPIFLSNEETDYVQGKVKKVTKDYFSEIYYVDFEYLVSNNKYNRAQLVDGTLGLNITENSKCLVQYLLSNPQRSKFFKINQSINK